MLDIDHFNAFNDHYGHLKGDECLRRVADALAQNAHRVSDLVHGMGERNLSAFCRKQTNPMHCYAKQLQPIHSIVGWVRFIRRCNQYPPTKPVVFNLETPG
jgi:diguanylate cyclase (GGDEF)-like protein